MTEFGIKLRTLRALKGISRQQLASALGWPITTLGIYERDRIPEPHKVEAIAKFFGVSPCWMLFGEDAMGGNTLHKIPIIPPAYASQWKEAINNFDDTYNEWPALVVACPVGRHTYALEVATTSMAPVIPPGVCVVVEPEMEPVTMDYVIARVGKMPSDVTLKQYIEDGEQRLLMPHDPAYPARVMDEEMEVLGVVREMVRNFR